MNKKTLVVLLLLAVLVNAVQQQVYVLTLEYDGEMLEKKSLFVTNANFVDSNEKGKFTLKVISFENETLYAKQFGIPTEIGIEPSPEWFSENGSQIVVPQRPVVIELTSKQLLIPYFTHGKSIEIENNGEKILRIDIAQLARTCGDAVCQEHESYLTCEADCPEQITNEPGAPFNYLPIAISIIVIALVIVGYFLFARKTANVP